MRMNLWFVLGLVLAPGVFAQQITNVATAPVDSTAAAVTNLPPAIYAESNATPAAVTTAKPPAKPTAKKSATRKKAAAKKTTAIRHSPASHQLRTVPLTPGPATVVANRVNIRAKASLKGEVIAQLTKGDLVNVIEEVTLANSGPEEPSAWAKVSLPPGAHVWVSALFVDLPTSTVHARKLNLRAGPGENYGVIGRLQKGDTFKQIDVKGEWVEIEPPMGAYAFMAAQYLKQEPAAAIAATTPTAGTPTEETKPAEPSPTPTEVTESPAVTPAATEPATPPPTNAAPEIASAPSTNATETAVTPATESAAAEPAPEEPLPPRIVQREGIVRSTLSIQAPTKYELYSPESRTTINYLYTDSPDLDLSRYKGLRIVVSGEEGLDERWRNTPVITIQKIDVVE